MGGTCGVGGGVLGLLNLGELGVTGEMIVRRELRYWFSSWVHGRPSYFGIAAIAAFF